MSLRLYSDCKDFWCGFLFLSVAEKDRIESLAQRCGYLPSSFVNVQSRVDTMESKLCVLYSP